MQSTGKNIFTLISSDDKFSTFDLAAVYKKALQMDPNSEQIRKKLNMLEYASHRPQTHKTPDTELFFPVSPVEILSFSESEKKEILQQLENISRSNPSDQKLKSTISMLS